MPEFTKGDRVRLSEFGIENLWRFKDKQERTKYLGTIINRNKTIHGRFKTVSVRWDHIKTPTAYIGVQFLEKI